MARSSVPNIQNGAHHHRLAELAIEAAHRAYAPYSHFRVGAAVMTDRGVTFSGANIESASFSASLCAERSALAAALSAGHRTITRVAIAFLDTHAISEDALVPCGTCLQWLAEFAASATVSVSPTGRSYLITDLLPNSFTGIRV